MRGFFFWDGMSVTIYLDESGDPGWIFDKPYGNGGSSRFLVLAAVIAPYDKTHQLERIVRGMYKRRKRPKESELKSVHLNSKDREHFAKELVTLAGKHPDIRFTAIAVQKPNVCSAFRRYYEGLYNYVTMTMLVDEIGQHADVDLIPDHRDMKPRHRHGMHDFMLTNLACREYETRLNTTPSVSNGNMALQFADYLASLVWGRYEYGAQGLFETIAPHVQLRELYFSPPASVGEPADAAPAAAVEIA